MSLMARLWSAIALSTVIGFLGSLAVSLWTARSYLEQQLYVQSADGANSLALAMSQQAKDPASIELQVSALFDNGHYRRVRFQATGGTPVIERVQEEGAPDVPAWFEAALPLGVAPATAQISEGWAQAGTLTVEAHPRFAYAALWRGAGGLLAFCAMIGIVAGWLGSLFVRQLRKPLADVVGQARAISERRFLQIDEPAIPELREVAGALNSSVARLQHLFSEQAERMDSLRREASIDPVSGLANRGFFLGRLQAELSEAEAAGAGQLVLLRLSDLRAINDQLGRSGTDELLARLAEELSRALPTPEALAGRLAGADFAWLLPDARREEALARAEALAAALTVCLRQASLGFEHRIGLAVLGYRHGQAVSEVLAQAEAALLEAGSAAAGKPVVAGMDEAAPATVDWAATLDEALREGRYLLQAFPVLSVDGALLHEELVLRLARPGSEPLPAASFLAEAARLDRLGMIDAEVLRLGLEWVKQRPGPVALNLSGEALRDAGLRTRLRETLFRNPIAAGQLWLEFGEGGLGAWHGTELKALAQFAHSLRPLNIRVGIDHFGRRFDKLPQLHELGLDYLKIDAAFVLGIETLSEHASLIKAVASVGRSLDMLTIACGVNTRREWQSLAELGLAGLTGPVTRLGGE
ncbi:MAG: EAL domain-containing protein [Gammaproteobacteria bacterium]|nr:EAL domain-containing protein [Gammaproteobacteria bacterium]